MSNELELMKSEGLEQGEKYYSYAAILSILRLRQYKNTQNNSSD